MVMAHATFLPCGDGVTGIELASFSTAGFSLTAAAVCLAFYATRTGIPKAPKGKTKSSREQESTGVKLVTRSGVLYETKKVWV